MAHIEIRLITNDCFGREKDEGHEEEIRLKEFVTCSPNYASVAELMLRVIFNWANGNLSVLRMTLEHAMLELKSYENDA